MVKQQKLEQFLKDALQLFVSDHFSKVFKEKTAVKNLKFSSVKKIGHDISKEEIKHYYEVKGIQDFEYLLGCDFDLGIERAQTDKNHCFRYTRNSLDLLAKVNSSCDCIEFKCINPKSLVLS